MSIERILVQQMMCARVAASQFYQVKYTPGSGSPILNDPTDLVNCPNVPPASVRVNEENSNFTVDKDFGAKEILKQTGWVFSLYMEWNNIEVDLSYFEEDLMLGIPFIVKGPHNRSAKLYLLKKNVQHPVQQEASTGTAVKYLFQAELGRA